MPRPPRPTESADQSRGAFRRLRSLSLRDIWWGFLNLWESHRWLRRLLISALVLVVVGVGLRLWVYPSWARHNAIKFAHEWLALDRLANAAEAADRAARLAPDSPEPWLVAAEIARRLGNGEQALAASRRAAELAPEDPEAIIAWAADSLRANLPEEATRALNSLPFDATASSGHARRIRGDLARQRQQFDEAVRHFEAAAELEGAQAINQIPLALVLLQSTEPTVRQRGFALLDRWSGDADWGPVALRTLLENALEHNLPDARRHAEALLAHPQRTVGDMPLCLHALARQAPARYREVLQGLERDHAVSPEAAAQLINWLNQIGQHDDALRWLRALPQPAQEIPPLAPLVAEALRATGAWEELRTRSQRQKWDAEVDFLRWTYGLAAARQLGDLTGAENHTRTLLAFAPRAPGQTLFAAGSLYTWGYPADAVSLWEALGTQPGPIALEALGALVRHHQLHRDAEGQYRAFRQLHFLQPANRDLANNFAFFALLTGRDQRLAEQLAQDNHTAAPDNPTYAATQAFALLQRNRAADAVALLAPLASPRPSSPAVAFAYALALAGTGKKEEARTLLATLPEDTRTQAEKTLITRLLGSP